MTTPKLPLDPALAAIVAGMPPPELGSIFDLPATEARRIFDANTIVPNDSEWADSIERVEDSVATDGSNSVPVRIYRPRLKGPVPTLLFLHGGGFVLGGINQMDDIARRICRDVGAVVVSADYRLAPEAKFPAAADDALLAAKWTMDHVAELGGDRDRIGLVGESAGGNLALHASIALKHVVPGFAAQLLIVPAVDLSETDDDTVYPVLNAWDLRAISRAYLGDDFGPADTFPPSPLYANDLSGLPPTVIGVAGHDILTESILQFVKRLENADVPVRLRLFGDMFHPFFGFAHVSPGAATAGQTLCADLRDALESASSRAAKERA